MTTLSELKEPLESELQSALLLAAPASLPSLRLFRRNISKVKIRDHTVRFGLPGQCDLYGYLRGGQTIEVELKASGKGLNPDQKKWRDWCVEWEVPHVVLTARKGETTEETMRRWIEELRAVIQK